MEPYKVKTIEHLSFSSREEREGVLKQVGCNPFLVPSRYVTFDLLTDSGAGGMSSVQWATVLNGDESYAGARSFHNLEEAGKRLTNLPHVFPVHQARAAECILFKVAVPPNTVVLGNGFLDTGRIHLERLGATPINIAIQPLKTWDFNGDINVKLLERYITRGTPKVSMVYISVTCHKLGGQPVSMACLKEVSLLCHKHKIALYLDAAHYATNSWFIKIRERGFSKHKPLQICKEMFALCDGCLISAKKDGHCNTGAILATKVEDHVEGFSQQLILTEGFLTYGGMTGRDMEAAAIGLLEALEENYLRYRLESVAAFGEMLKSRNVPIVEPVGGHAVCIDAGTLLSHLDTSYHPAWAFGCALFIEGGIRGAEDGNVMNCRTQSTHDESRQLFRLSIPARTYTLSHLEYITEVIAGVVSRRTSISGLKMKQTSDILGHFTATFESINKEIYPKCVVKKKTGNLLNGYRRV